MGGNAALNTYISKDAFGGMLPNGVATGIDWQKAYEEMQSHDGRNQIAKAVSDYFNEVRKAANDPLGRYDVKTTRSGHIPGSLPGAPDLELSFYGPEVDAGVMAFFRFINKTQSKNPTINLANVSAQAIVFEQKQEGQPARIRKVSGGTPNPLTSVTWHGALGIDDDAKRFDEFDIFEENVQRVPVVWDAKMAQIHTDLLTALGAGVNESWNTDLITTLNSGGAQIVEDCGDIYSLPDNPTLYLLYNHRNWKDVKQALTKDFTLANDNNSDNELQWNIVPIKTRRIPVKNFYLGLPGYNTVTVEWDALYSEFGRDWATGTDNFVYRARRNAGIMNVNQFRRIIMP